MKLTFENGTCLLTPTTSGEIAVLGIWKANLKPEDEIAYRGRGPNDGEFWTVKLEAANVGITLVGETEKDKFGIQDLRNAFFNSGGPHFMEAAGDGVRIYGRRCKVCGATVIEMHSCEWQTCDACAAKCKHEVEKGFTHSNVKELDVGHYCVKCGRGQPSPESVHYTDHHGGTECSKGEVPDSIVRTEVREKVTCATCKELKGIVA